MVMSAWLSHRSKRVLLLFRCRISIMHFIWNVCVISNIFTVWHNLWKTHKITHSQWLYRAFAALLICCIHEACFHWVLFLYSAVLSRLSWSFKTFPGLNYLFSLLPSGCCWEKEKLNPISPLSFSVLLIFLLHIYNPAWPQIHSNIPSGSRC